MVLGQRILHLAELILALLPLCHAACSTGGSSNNRVCQFACSSIAAGAACPFSEAYKLCSGCSDAGAAATPAAALISSLMAFYDFRQGYANQAAGGPGSFALTPSAAVTRNSSGARFDGTTAAYIDVNTQSQALLAPLIDGSRGNFSFYVRARRSTYYMATYHFLFNCASPGSSYFSGLFGEESGALALKHTFSGPNSQLILASTRTFAPADGSLQDASLGIAMSVGAFKTLFGQGAAYADATVSSLAFTYVPTCLRLGYHASVGYGLNGILVCYAIANRTLTEAEFGLLHLRCGG